MKSKLNQRSLLGALVCTWVVATGGALAARAADHGPAQGPARESTDRGARLIETAPDVTQWMTPEQVETLVKRGHEAGACPGFLNVTDFQASVTRLRPFSPLFDLGMREGFPTPSQAATVTPLLGELRREKLLAVVEHLSSYRNRFYNFARGAEAATWVRDELRRRAGGRQDITVELFTHAKFKQPSVIARIPGRGPHAAERIILGGHLDSITKAAAASPFPLPDQPGGLFDFEAPGADDNASGIGTLLEAFRVIAESGFRPDRTLEFIGYAGEEGGLLGSQEIAQSYLSQGIEVAAVIQFDMTMHPALDHKMVLMTDFVHPELTRFTATLIDTYVHAPWKESKCGYGCSDHAAWTKAGYATVFPTESSIKESNQMIHSAGDTLANALDADFALNYARLATAFAVELSLAPAASVAAYDGSIF